MILYGVFSYFFSLFIFLQYDVPLVKLDGTPQPIAYMLERNREQFPGFRGDEIADKIHEYEGLQYYSVPTKYVHFLIGSVSLFCVLFKPGLLLTFV